MTDFVTLFEVGPRDGLQNEKTPITTSDKIKLINFLSHSGFKKIETTSFVSPKWVPQMADASDVMAGINRSPNTSYAALTPNMRGLEGAKATQVDEIAIFASASEGFSQANINCSIAESLDRFTPVFEAAKDMDLPVRAYVSSVIECPYDGPTKPGDVAHVAEALLEGGAYEISLGDTIGAGTPDTLATLLEVLLSGIPTEKLAGHYHDTCGQALANIRHSLEKGLRTFDTSIAGLGGCPYAPGAKGNVATEAVADLLANLGFETGLDRQNLATASAFAKTLRKMP